MADLHVIAPRPTHHLLETQEQCIARMRPGNSAEAATCMKQALEYLYRRQDNRAIFLRAYSIMTIEVNAAIHGHGSFTRSIFLDPPWVDRLTGRFAQLYFESFLLSGAERNPWAMAHEVSQRRHSSIIQNLLLGINAHINYDLAFGIYEHLLHHGDYRNHLLLYRRKFDHDQINNILVKCLPKIQDSLSREFGGGMRFFSRLGGKLDEQLTVWGLKHYRERVWWNALSFLATEDEQEQSLVRDRLSWESLQVSQLITGQGPLYALLYGVDGLLRRRHFAALQLEAPGGTRATRPVARRMRVPF